MDDDHPNGSARADLFNNPSSTLRLRDSDGSNEGRDGDENTDAEARMRHALGLFGTRSPASVERGHHDQHGGGGRTTSGGGAGARRHRFVQDGEVPVSLVRGRAPQLRPGGGENDRHGEELAAERQARVEAERRLADKDVQLRSLQTRIGHAELERDAALAEAREWRDRAEQMLAAAPPAASPTATTATTAGERADDDRADAPGDDEPAGPGGRRGVGRRRVEETPTDGVDPEPVKWWL